MIKLPLNIYFLYIYDPFQKFSGPVQKKRALEAHVNGTPLDSPCNVVCSKSSRPYRKLGEPREKRKILRKIGNFYKNWLRLII